MSSDECEYLERLFAAYVHDSGPLSDWERSFMNDQQQRWEKYAEGMLLSPKQWNIMRKLGKVYGIQEPGEETGK